MSLRTSMVMILAFIPAASGIAKVALHSDPHSSIPLKMACDRLAKYLRDCPEDGEIRVLRLTTPDQTLGDEGYAIRSRDRTITIEANTDAGAANGVYSLLRTLMIEDLPTPWGRAWDLREKPAFGWRSMMVAPYNFGGAHGFSVFSPDQWALTHWQAYLDEYWEGTDQLANIDRAARLFDQAKTGESSYQLEYTADMLSLMPGIHRLNQAGLSPEEAETIRKQLFAETQRRYILQGFGSTDYQWVPEADGYFRAFLGMCTPVPLSPPPPPENADKEERKTPNP